MNSNYTQGLSSQASVRALITSTACWQQLHLSYVHSKEFIPCFQIGWDESQELPMPIVDYKIEYKSAKSNGRSEIPEYKSPVDQHSFHLKQKVIFFFPLESGLPCLAHLVCSIRDIRTGWWLEAFSCRGMESQNSVTPRTFKKSQYTI